MSNERLRSCLATAELTYDELAEQVEVDPKTVERWVTKDRMPHRAHRLKVASLLRADEVFLWPKAKSDLRTIAASQAEFVALYPNRSSVEPDLWGSLVERATEQIDLLAFAASFLHDGLPGFAEQIEDKARQGVCVRLIFGDPDSTSVQIRGEEEGIGDLLAARCRLNWAYWKPFLSTPGIEARMHGSTLYNSVFRFDDTAMVNQHALGAAASHSPVMHIQKIAGGRLFAHYLEGVERTWKAARPLE